MPIEYVACPSRNETAVQQNRTALLLAGLEAVRQGRPGLGTGQADLGVSLKPDPVLE
jgi:hypothetical protein